MANEVDDYDVLTTGGDSLEWDEKAVPKKGFPQRGRRPDIDLTPEGDNYYDSRNDGADFYTGNTFTDYTGTYGVPTDHKGPKNHFNLSYSERKMGDKPEDFRGSANPFKPEGDKQLDSWFASQSLRFTDKVMRDYDDQPGIDNNRSVPERTGWKEREHGWQVEPSEALPGGESGSENKADRSLGADNKPRAGKP